MPTAASAQGVPVIDPGNIAQTVKVVQNGVQQIQQLKSQLSELQNIKSMIGKVGENQLQSILSGSGFSLTGEGSDDTLTQLKSAVPGLLDALPSSETGKSLGITAGSAAKARTSIQAGREFALSSFYKSGNATMDDVTARRGVRQAAMRDSLTAGYAMAVFAKNDINKSETVMKSLSEQLSASKDLRTDVQGNSAVALAQLRQMTIQNQLMAQMLEVQSTAAMADDGMGSK
jgi:conjugal transfer/entry exclusion protein